MRVNQQMQKGVISEEKTQTRLCWKPSKECVLEVISCFRVLGRSFKMRTENPTTGFRDMKVTC